VVNGVPLWKLQVIAIGIKHMDTGFLANTNEREIMVLTGAEAMVSFMLSNSFLYNAVIHKFNIKSNISMIIKFSFVLLLINLC